MTGRWVLLAGALLALTMVVGVSGVALADHDGQRCTVGTLDGLYVFASPRPGTSSPLLALHNRKPSSSSSISTATAPWTFPERREA